MTQLTDPARELADLCDSLRQENDATGSGFLAARFQVPEWSAEFYQIIFSILQRIDDVATLVRSLDMDTDYKDEMAGHVEALAGAFKDGALRNTWRQGMPGPTAISREIQGDRPG